MLGIVIGCGDMEIYSHSAFIEHPLCANTDNTTPVSGNYSLEEETRKAKSLLPRSRDSQASFWGPVTYLYTLQPFYHQSYDLPPSPLKFLPLNSHLAPNIPVIIVFRPICIAFFLLGSIFPKVLQWLTPDLTKSVKSLLFTRNCARHSGSKCE